MLAQIMLYIELTFCCISFMYCENHSFVSSSPVMMMSCNNVTTPVGVGGGANTCPNSILTSGLKLVPESKPGVDISFSSESRAMERASVGCL